MQKKWGILGIVMLIYIPVAIDATVLHVAIPTLSRELAATSNQLLWIIDIYSLVMAGLLLPMGALGDRIGYKKLAMYGTAIFGLASLAAALSPNAMSLIVARSALAVGASMILPATLLAVRITFLDAGERSIALGVWTAIGSGGAAAGPLLGGWILEHFYWGAVFLINLPIVVLVLITIYWLIPKQQAQPEQPWSLRQALVLITAILLLVYALKNGLRAGTNGWMTLGCALLGGMILLAFIRQQLRAVIPMIDLRLLTKRVMALGVVMALTALIALVGFEFTMAQELQFVLGFTPLEAGLFMLPMMIASGISGPLAGWFVSLFGLRFVATLGMAFSALSFYGLSAVDFVADPLWVKVWMALFGFSFATALLASGAAIMSSIPPEKAGAAGAIEGMAYELGAGFGVAFFGLLVTQFYHSQLLLPPELPAAIATQAANSIGEAMQAATQLQGAEAKLLQVAAQSAFSAAHHQVLVWAAIMLSLVTLLIGLLLPSDKPINATADQHIS